MAVNKPTGDNSRKGAVRQRSQVLNPKNNLWVKRDTTTGKFLDVNKYGHPHKGMRKENNNQSNN